jgi:hypothetical protein
MKGGREEMRKEGRQWKKYEERRNRGNEEES